MKLETFILAAQAAYGDNWVTPIAVELNVSDRTVRNWKSGKYQLPDSIAHDVLKMLELRKDAIQLAIKATTEEIG